MDNESGESIEPMEEVPLKGLGESELTELVCDCLIDGQKPALGSRNEGKHTGMNCYSQR